MSKIPFWARKPEHKSEVIATPRGWVVEETGEMLKVVKDLTAKLEKLGVEDQVVEAVVVEETPVELPVEEPVIEQEPEVVEEQPKPRRGRKPKSEQE